MKSLHIALATAATVFCLATSAQAQTVSVSPVSSTIAVDGSVTLDFKATGFLDPIFGGGFNLSYDPTIVELVGAVSIPASWEFAPSSGTSAAGTVTNISFNSFAAPPKGDFLTASATFKGVGPGTSAITLTPSGDFPFGKAGGVEVPVTFESGSITVTAVPEPSSLALLAAGLACSVALARRRKA